MADGFGINDPLRPLLGKVPAKVTSKDSLKNILSQLTSVQTSQSGIRALGKKPGKKTKKGFISGLFDPEQGLLFAPARAVSAGVADVLGLAQDTELADYNPLEAALRAGKGEFAVTGGDIIRTEEGDSIPERALKLGGAFAWDVITDPLNYVGGAGVFTRKGVLAATLGDDVLRRNLIAKLETEALKKKSASEVSGILNRLASESREALTGKFVTNVDPVTKQVFSLTDEAGQVISKEVRDGLAAKTLANQIADGFTRRGRAGIVDNISSAVGDTDIAQTLFQSLDKELVGGLFLKNPITGKPLARIAGGKGGGNVLTDAANQLRFRTSAGFGGRWGSRDLSGRFGPSWSAYKAGLLTDNYDRLAAGRTLFTDFSDYKIQLRELKANLAGQMSKLHASQSHVLRLRAKLSEEERKSFDDQIKYFFHNPTDKLDDVPQLTGDARDAALELRKNFEEAMDEFRALGIDLGYQEGFVPLMYSDEYLDYLMKYDPKQGAETRKRYRGNLSRVAYSAPMDVQDVDALADIPNADALKALTPVEANKVANPVRVGDAQIDVFETDPVKLLQRYTEWAARTAATARFVQGLETAGVVLKFAPETARTVNIYNAKAMASAVGQLSTDAGVSLRQQLRAVKEQLKNMVSDETIAAREAQRAGLLVKAQADFDTADTRMVEAVAYLRDLNRQLIEFEPSVARLKKLILNKDIRRQTKVIASVEETVERFARDVRNAKARLARAQDNADLSKRTKEILEQMVEKEEPGAAGALKQVKREAREDAAKALQIEKEMADEIDDLRDVQESLDVLRRTLEGNAELFATDEFQSIVSYFRVLEEKNAVQRRIADVYRPARRDARANMDLLNRDIAMPRADAIRSATFTYVELRRRYGMAVSRLRAIEPKLRTVADKNKVKAARDAMQEAKDDLKSLIADVDPSRTKIETVGRTYLADIVRMADDLTTEQVKAAMAFADSKKLAGLIDTLNDPTISHDIRMQAYGDMMAAYRSIRRYVSQEQLDSLAGLERLVYNEPDLAWRAKDTRYTAKIRRLRDDLDAASARNDIQEVKRLRSEIDKVEALTEEDGLRLIGANKVKVPRTLEDMYAPMGVRQQLERFYQLENNPTEWESFIGKVYDPLALVWKTAATVGRGPAYTLTNLIGGLVNNYLGDVSVKDHALASKILWAYDKGVRDALRDAGDVDIATASKAAVENVKSLIGDLDFNTPLGKKKVVEAFEEFLQSGTWLTTDVMSQAAQLRRAGLTTDPFILAEQPGIRYEWADEAAGRTENAFRSTVNTLLTWRGQRFMNEINQNTEMFGRLAAFISGYRRFGSKHSAVDNVMMLHFDYQDLSDAEQWIKRFVPFYTWTRNNIPLQMRAAFLQQDKVRKLILLNENFKDAFGADGDDSWLQEVLPDYIDVNGGFASVFKFSGNHLALFPKTPIQDVDKLFSMGSIFGIPVPVPRLRETAQMLGPAVSPLEFITNTNFDTGQQFRTAEDKALQLSRSLIPYIGTIQRIASGLTVPATLSGADLSGVPFIQADKGMSNLFNFLVGAPYGASTLTEKSVYGGLIQKSIASGAELTKYAAEAGVDVEWLRKEIKKGTSLQDLRTKIAMGEGSARRIEQQKRLDMLTGKTKEKQPAQDYAQVLATFRAGKYGGF